MDENLYNTLMEIHSKVSVLADKVPGIEQSLRDQEKRLVADHLRLEKETQERIVKSEDRIKLLENRQLQFGTIITIFAFIMSVFGNKIINIIGG